MKLSYLGFAFVATMGLVAACGTSSGGGTTSGTTTTGGGGGGQLLPVGSPCKADTDCGGAEFMCMTDHPDGYCIKMCDIKNGDADCPSESICQDDGSAGECHKSCNTGTDCRAGYECAPASAEPMNTASHAFCDMAEVTDAGPG